MSKVKTPLINLVPNQNSKTELKKTHFQIAKGKLYLYATEKFVSYFLLPESTIQTQPELQNGFCHPQIPFFCDQAIHPEKSLSQNTPRLTAVLCPPSAPEPSAATGAGCCSWELCRDQSTDTGELQQGSGMIKIILTTKNQTACCGCSVLHAGDPKCLLQTVPRHARWGSTRGSPSGRGTVDPNQLQPTSAAQLLPQSSTSPHRFFKFPTPA